jgi:hypothetical protein
VPWWNASPQTSASLVSRWASTCTTASGPCFFATARIAGSAMEWSPPTANGTAPAATMDAISFWMTSRASAGANGGTATLPPSAARSVRKTSTLWPGWNP